MTSNLQPLTGDSLSLKTASHRIVEAGKQLWRSSNPTPLPRARSASVWCSALCPVSLEFLQGQTLHSLLGQPALVFNNPHSNKHFPLCSHEISCISVCAFASCPLTEHHWEEHGSVFFPSPIRYILIRSPWAFSFRLHSPSSLKLSLCDRKLPPLIIFVTLHWTLSDTSRYFLYWGAQTWTQCSSALTQVWPHQGWEEWRIMSLDLLAVLCPVQPGRLLAPWDELAFKKYKYRGCLWGFFPSSFLYKELLP